MAINNKFNISEYEVTLNDVLFLGRKMMEVGSKGMRTTPLCLCARPGIGKSSVIQQLCKEFGIDVGGNQYHEIRVANVVDSSDLMGLPFITKKLKSEDGVTSEFDHTTRYSMSELLPIDNPSMSEEERQKLHVIFFDEINRSADPAIMNAIFQLTTEYRVGPHKLLPNVVIFLALNPEAEGYIVNSMDPAFVNRINFQFIKPNFSQWKDYAAENDIDSNIVDFLESQPGFFSSDGILKNSADDKRFPTPRAWVNVDKALKVFDFDIENKHQNALAVKTIAGIVGGNAALSFVEFLHTNKDKRPISGEDILDRYLTDKAMQARVRKMKGDTRVYDTTMVATSISGIEDIFRKKAMKLCRNELANTLGFLVDIPVEQSMSFQNLITLEISQEFTNWFFETVTSDATLAKLWKVLQESTRKYNSGTRASSL